MEGIENWQIGGFVDCGIEGGLANELPDSRKGAACRRCRFPPAGVKLYEEFIRSNDLSVGVYWRRVPLICSNPIEKTSCTTC